MSGFVKIYGSKLITSSLWDESPEARLVFLSMLAIADADGYVDVPNERSLARVLNLEIDYVERALSVLMAPDKGSRTEDFEGRRVLRDGSGWRCVNYEKYREFRSAAQEATRRRVQRHRENKGVTGNGSNGNVTPVTTEAEAEAEAEAKKRSDSSEPSPAPEPTVFSFPVVGDPDVTEWGIVVSQDAEFRAAFPGLDVMAEYRKASAWLTSNPGRRKTARGMMTFLFNWLSRTQNRGRPKADGGPLRQPPVLPTKLDMRR